ncbi:MAG TPA: M56 family metallopeptidase [Candidatus Limnocylindria bacterium]|jgi:beta-lactamase regulating signal transducer with metallopeptidase domain/Flp pilus assembly secretin CpaC|nr:M56 family metallopeptidase [Candidatus Limnocylindria bacterium]
MNLTLSLWLTLLGRLAIEAVLLVALATAAQRFLASPRAKGTLWQAVLLSLALVWVAELGGVRGQVARWWPQPRATRHLVATVVGEPVSNLTVPDGLDAAVEPAFPEAVAKPGRPVWWPLQLWLAGFATLLFRATALRFWLGFTASRRPRVTDAGLLNRVENLRRCVGLRRVRVLAWPGLRSPIAFGTLQPTIALPADFVERFSHEAQEAMLAHELAHLAAGDPFWLAVADAVLALAWWHPAVWWARQQLRAASEATADEASALVPGGRVALAESLVTFGRELAAPGWTRGLGVAGDGLKSQLARRVTALLRPAGEWRAVRPARLWLARGATLITASGLVALPWPGAGGPAFAEVLMASAAEAFPTPSASGKPLKLHFQTVPATEVPPASGRALSESARLSYEAFPVKSPPAVNGLNLSNPYRGEISLPDESAKPLREQYQEGAPKLRTVPGVSDDWKKPAHPVYVALRVDDPAGESRLAPAGSGAGLLPGNSSQKGQSTPAELKAEPAPDPELQRRYQEAMQAAKEADVAAGPIFIKYGKDSAEGRQAADRYECAREKVSLLKSAIEMDGKLEALRGQYGEQHHKVVEALAGRNGLLASVERLSQAETNAVPVLFTRQFRLRGDQGVGFGEQVRRFMPTGETNLQVAVRAFCVTNGMAMRPPEGDLPPMAMADRSAVFYNEGKGVLFVRASLGDLHRLERAIQTVSVPPAEADEIRSGQAKVLQASTARLAELRTQYGDDDPKVREELETQADIRSSQRDFELNGRTAVTNAPPAGASADARRQVELEVFFAEVTERGPDDLGFDWVFGKSPTNNPALQNGPATNLLTEPGSPHGQNLRVDLLRTEGESAILTEAQFAALRKQLNGRSGVEFLASPRVITQFGRQARVEVGEEKTIVSGMEPTPASGTNQAGINYQTEKVRLGPKVDLFPVLDGDNARVGIVASVTEFLGYDQPAAPSRDKSGKGMAGVSPLPRLRMRTTHADSLAKPGETIVLRGPLVAETTLLKDKVPVLGDVPLLGRLFRSESKSTVRKRLYVFVTPTEITATGERRWK